MFRSPVLALCVLVAMPAVARAQATWRRTFKPNTVATYIRQDQSLLVAAAGEGEAAKTAADALREAITAMRKARIVMDASALGDIDVLDDPTIVKRASRLPVDAIAIVRVFPGAAGETAVVTIYDKRGEVLNAFTGEKGTPVVSATGDAKGTPAAKGGRSDPGQGVSARATSAVEEVLRTSPSSPREPVSDAQAEYNKRAVGFIEIHAVNLYGDPLAVWQTPFQGIHRKPLEGADFYEAIDQPDLADEYRRRRSRRLGYIIGGFAGGGALLLTGAIVAGAFSGSGDCLEWSGYGSITSFSCVKRGTSAGEGVGYAMLAISGVAMITLPIIGFATRQEPVTPHRARELADEYNKKLRRELGLPPEERQSRRGEEPRPTLAVSPMGGPQGGGLAIIGTF